MKEKIAFGVIVGTRGFFNPKLAASGRRELIDKLTNMGYEVIILPEDATPTGAIETLDDAKKCAKLFNEHRYEIDGIIVSLPNFGDELGIVNALHYSDLKVPVLVHAWDDELGKESVEERRDSFCGKISVCNNLYQYGIPFTDTTYHTCTVQSDEFTQDIRRFEKICRVVNGLRNARIGVIGTRPAPFQTVRSSEKLLQASGITVVPVDLSEIINTASSLSDESKEVKETVENLKQYGKIPSYIKEENILKQAKLYVTLNRWIEENDIDAIAVQCWASIQQNYGCAACASMSMLGNRLIPSACEADIDGAVSMYALTLAAGEPSALMDWNNNYGDDRDKCMCTHCSNFPRAFMNNEIEISNLDVLGASLGYEKCFGAVKGKVAAGPMTFFRIMTDSVRGKIKAYLGEGDFTNDPTSMDGGIAVCNLPGLQKLMKYMTKNGFPHHGAFVRTHCADVLEEALSTYFGWDLYYHNHE